MLTVLGHRRQVCNGLNRRTLLQVAGAGLFGVSLPRVLAAEKVGSTRPARVRSVIFVFLFGGPSQLETFDMNGQQDGRDHWNYCFPCLLAGAGVRGGIVYGRSDKDAAYPADRPVSPADLTATIFEALGIYPHQFLPDSQGRPQPLVTQGRALDEVLA